MIELEQYFIGEEGWNNYSSISNEFWVESDFQIKITQLLENRIDIAKVVFFHMGEGSINWLNSKVPALDNLTPLECLEKKQLVKRLKTCLMRFPV